MTSHNELCNDVLELIGKEVIKKREQDTLAYHCDRIEMRSFKSGARDFWEGRAPTICAWCPPLPHYPLRYKRSILKDVVDELETEVAFVWGGRLL